MNGKLKLVKARKPATSDTEEEDDYDEDEEMPEEIGTPTPKVYDTSERDGRYIPIRTNPEEDALQLHTDGEISGEKIETNINGPPEIVKNRINTVPYHTRETFGVRNKNVLIETVFVTGNLWTRTKGTPQPEKYQKPADFLPEEETPSGPSNQN